MVLVLYTQKELRKQAEKQKFPLLCRQIAPKDGVQFPNDFLVMMKTPF
jgi:hypothetical protein